jgi:hypothetical protein
MNVFAKSELLRKQSTRDLARHGGRLATQGRTLLNEKEKELIAGVLREDLENKVLIGVLLEESVRDIFANKTEHQRN